MGNSKKEESIIYRAFETLLREVDKSDADWYYEVLEGIKGTYPCGYLTKCIEILEEGRAVGSNETPEELFNAALTWSIWD